MKKMISYIILGVGLGFALSILLQNLTAGLRIYLRLKSDGRIISVEEVSHDVRQWSKIFFLRDVWGYNAIIVSKENEDKVSDFHLGLLAHGVLLNSGFKSELYWKKKFPDLDVENISVAFFG